MGKKVDINGFWTIKDNPITKEGVFPYSGSQIDFDGSLGLEPNKEYSVYRPAEELIKDEAVASFNGDPMIDEHEMVGDGYTKYDARPAGGVMLNVRPDESGTGLVSDLKIYSESVKDSIEGGKKALSLGYRCRYEQRRGVFGGSTYDFIQRDINGNHIALVDRGRMGSDVRVYDSKATVFDSIAEVNQIHKGEDTMTDAEKLADKRAKISTALDGILSDEEMTAVQDALDPQEEKATDDGAPEGNKNASEGKAEPKADEKPIEKVEDEDEEKQKAEDMEESEEKKDAAAMDAFPKFAKLLAARDELVKLAEPLVGAFDSAVMTTEQVAVYTCAKLGIACDSKDALPMLRGYLLASKPAAKFAMDAAPKVGPDAGLTKYLKGE